MRGVGEVGKCIVSKYEGEKTIGERTWLKLVDKKIMYIHVLSYSMVVLNM